MVDLVIVQTHNKNEGGNGVICHSERNNEHQEEMNGNFTNKPSDVESSSRGSAFPSETSRLTPFTEVIPMS